jgi:lipocalin
VFIETKWCVQADYGLNPNGTVSVWNRERQDSVTGPVKQILGWADRSDPVKAPAELNVYLQGVPVS